MRAKKASTPILWFFVGFVLCALLNASVFAPLSSGLLLLLSGRQTLRVDDRNSRSSRQVEEGAAVDGTGNNGAATDLQDEALLRKKKNLGFFEQIADMAYESAVSFRHNETLKEESPRRQFNLSEWNHQSMGGLNDIDRILLGRIYSQASSVFEYGLGESTLIANHVGVPRYAGIDSDPVWVARAREQVLPSFRFYLADIGPTGVWGYPQQKLGKARHQYQIAPLVAEPRAFDVYLVDGRWRVACLLTAFLHAASRNNGEDDALVLVHDCDRNPYHVVDALFNVTTTPGSKLCQYRRLPNTTDGNLSALWQKYSDESLR